MQHARMSKTLPASETGTMKESSKLMKEASVMKETHAKTKQANQVATPSGSVDEIHVSSTAFLCRPFFLDLSLRLPRASPTTSKAIMACKPAMAEKVINGRKIMANSASGLSAAVMPMRAMTTPEAPRPGMAERRSTETICVAIDDVMPGMWGKKKVKSTSGRKWQDRDR